MRENVLRKLYATILKKNRKEPLGNEREHHGDKREVEVTETETEVVVTETETGVVVTETETEAAVTETETDGKH